MTYPVLNLGKGSITFKQTSGEQLTRDDILPTMRTEVVGSSTGNTLITGTGDDNVKGREGNDTIDTGDGNDGVFGEAGDDTITTGNGDDWVSGGRGNDTITTGNGDDWVDGGRGNDTIDTGDGNDVIEARAGYGNDTVYDFDAAKDRLKVRFPYPQFTTLPDASSIWTTVLENTVTYPVLNLGNGSITFKQTREEQLTRNDFLPTMRMELWGGGSQGAPLGLLASSGDPITRGDDTATTSANRGSSDLVHYGAYIITALLVLVVAMMTPRLRRRIRVLLSRPGRGTK